MPPAVITTMGAESPVRLTDVTARTGIGFVHTHGGSGRRYIVESVSAGLALFDYDGDGDVDVYFLNAAPLPGTKADRPPANAGRPPANAGRPPANAGRPPANALYRNDGGWRFTDVTRRAGVADTGFGLGVCVGDYDNDGDQDLYLDNYGPNVLYENLGDGTFADVTAAAGVANGQRVGAGANFLDVDRDGDLDLFVSNYLKFSRQTHVARTAKGVPKYPGPRDHRPESNTLYRNNGDGTFTDVSLESGVAGQLGWGMGTVCCDYDDDGDTDVFVANDVAGNFLFRNDGTGKFQEVGLAAGVAFDLGGREHGSMGAECGDYDNDGRLDLHVTSYQMEAATLYRNLGGGFFEDVTLPTGAGAGTLPYVTWGNGLVDFDNDGDRDLFIACGHIQDTIQLYDDTSSYHTRNVLLINDGKGRFVNASAQSGDGLQVKLASRGAAFDDLDEDGDVDVVVLNSRREPTILRNDSPGENHWIQIRLRGTKTNRDGVGARVKVIAGDLTQVDEVHSGRGYQSHYGTRLQFGLGKRDRVERIEVRWIGGGVNVVRDVHVDRLVTITE